MIRVLRWTLFFLLTAASVHAAEIEVSGRLDNLVWDHGRTATTAGKTFQGTDLFWTVDGSVTQELNDTLTFQGGWSNDPVLRWRLFGRLAMAMDNLSLRFSPFLGAFNSVQKWFNPGLETYVEYTWPGVLAVGGGFTTTFAPVAKAGDYYLAAQTVSVSSLMANGIVSFKIDDRSATFRQSDVLTTVDAQTKYSLDTEMFLKNVPIHWALLLGYQITDRTYVATTETRTTVHSALLGGRLAWDFGGGTSVYLQSEASVFSTGWGDTVWAVASSTPLVQTTLGARYHW